MKTALISDFLNMLVAARDAKVKRFVYATSSSTYGDHPGLPKVKDTIGKPLIPYAVTKYVNELYADVFTLLRDTLASHGVSATTQPVYRDFRAGDVRHSQADIGKAEDCSGHAVVCGTKIMIKTGASAYAVKACSY